MYIEKDLANSLMTEITVMHFLESLISRLLMRLLHVPFFCDRMAFVLFNSVSTFSYVLVQFVLGLNMVCDGLDYLIFVFTLVSESLVVTHTYRSCYLLFANF